LSAACTPAVLLLGAGVVLAQGLKTDERPGAPAAQQNAPAETPAEKMAPTLKSGQRKAPETTGQATAPKSDKVKSQTMDMDKGTPAGGAAKGSSDADLKSKGTNSPTESAAGAASPAGKSADEGKRSNEAVGSAKLSREQRTKITTIVMQHKVAPAQLNVSVEVGTRVPDSVHLYPLPQGVFAIYPEWRGFEYILVGDEIVVINPRTHEIVAIIEA
jgi:Protein of unknown function (DUF1236)